MIVKNIFGIRQKISMVNDVGELVLFHSKYFIKSCMKYMLEKNMNAFVQHFQILEWHSNEGNNFDVVMYWIALHSVTFNQWVQIMTSVIES